MLSDTQNKGVFSFSDSPSLPASRGQLVETVLPARIKAALAIIPAPVGAAFVPPLKSIVQVVTPAATQRARIWFTLAASRASPLKSIVVPSVGIQTGAENEESVGVEWQRVSVVMVVNAGNEIETKDVKKDSNNPPIVASDVNTTEDKFALFDSWKSAIIFVNAAKFNVTNPAIALRSLFKLPAPSSTQDGRLRTSRVASAVIFEGG